MPITTNLNFFAPVQAEFHVRRLPNVNFFCQKVIVPGLSLGVVNEQTPFSAIRLPGDHVMYNELEVTFKIDEYFTNYLEVMEWMIRNGFPEKYEQYRRLDKTRWSGNGPTSDGSVILLDSKGSGKLEVEVIDMFPMALSDVVVDTTARDIDYLTATAKFAYTIYRIKLLDRIGADEG